MRRIGFRLRLRTMMLLVAIVAMAIGGESMRRRWSYHRDQAIKYARAEQLMLGVAKRRDAEALRIRKEAVVMEASVKTVSKEFAASEHWNQLKAIKHSLTKMRRERAAWVASDAASYRESAARWKRLRIQHEYAASHPWLHLKIEPYPF